MAETTFKAPCSLGDPIWIIPRYRGQALWGVREDTIRMIGFTTRGIHIKTKNHSEYNHTFILNKNCFLTKEAALKSLEPEE